MNLDFPSVPGEQTRTLEELHGMKTVNKVDEAYNVVPTGASRLNEQKSAALKKRGHIVEEVAARAVSKQAQFYEEGKRVKKEIVEYTEVQEQTPNMPVPFINTTSRGAGQLSRKVSPAAPRRPNDQHGINPEQVPHVLLKDEAFLKNSCSIAELRKTDIEALQKPFKSKTSGDVSNDIGVEVNKARSDSCRLGYDECFKSIMTKIHEHLPFDVSYISGVQFKVKWNLELSDPSDKARFVKNFIHANQSSKFQSGTNNNAMDDQGDIANRSTSDNYDFNQLIEGNEDIHHKNQSYILGNEGANQSEGEQNKLKRKCNALGCVVTDSTRDSAIVNLQHEEPIPKKKCGNIPIFTLIDSELLKGSAEEQKTGDERIVLKLGKKEGKWEIKKDPPADGDEVMPEIQTSFEEDIMGIRTETNVPSYHYMANGVEEDDEQTLQYGFDGPFGRIIEN